MKDIEIHNGLDNKEIRDYFSKGLIDFETEERNLLQEFQEEKRESYQHIVRGDVLSYVQNSIKQSELEIKLHTKLLAIQQRKLAVFILIREKGWSEFDVSEHVTKTLDGVMTMSFIGTEEEYKTQINHG